MKVCTIVKNYIHRIPEGHTNIAINIIESLRTSGLEPTVVAVEPVTARSTDLGKVRHFSMLPLKNELLWNLAFSTRLHDAYVCMKMKLAKLNCDIIHLLNVPAWVYASILKAFRQKKCSTIAHLWYHNKLTGSFFWRQELWTLKRTCDRVVVTSKYLADYYRTFLGQKVTKVPLPVDTERYRPRDPLSARKYLELPLEDILIGYIGNLSPNRGVFDLLEALRYVKDVRLVIASPCIRDARLVVKHNHINAGNTMIFEDYRKKLGRSIMVLGALTHPELFYNAVNILVLPFKRPYAFTEPPLVVLEALSSGTPLITTPMGSIAEYTEHEYNAIHVAPHPRDIANAINKLIQGEDLRQRLSRNSRVSAMKLSLKNVGRQLLEIYRELYEERNGLVRAL